MKNKAAIFAGALLCILSLPTQVQAGRISPALLMESSLANGTNATPMASRADPFSTVCDYSDDILQLQSWNSSIPPTILGAIHLVVDPTAKEDMPEGICIPMIVYTQPGTKLEVVRPNATGTAWATVGRTATVGKSGLTARFSTDKPGIYAVFNPAWDGYLAEARMSVSAASRVDEARAMQSDFGLFLENSPSSDKIPLILVHGDNSYKQDKARWGDFLDWVDDNSEFDAEYEIWLFIHDTTQLIGYDGNTGNAKELGDAILAQFGNDRQILILAHSRGGLVSRSYMGGYADGNQGDRVLGLVTLGTPHHGSPAAVPEWGLETIKGEFRDVDLAKILYDYSPDAVVDVSDMGTMGLAWDNFDGPEHGIDYRVFTLESNLGNDHTLSVMDANLSNPLLEHDQSDPTIYLPDRSSGTLEKMNQDTRYAGKLIVYGGYDTELGLEEDVFLNLVSFSLTDHAGLTVATQIMANMRSKNIAETTSYHYMANDGMVPLQSALFLKKDSDNEPMTEVKEDTDLFFLDTYEIHLKPLSSRALARKAVICPDYDHLHMIESKGGVEEDKTDYWDHVADSLIELTQLTKEETETFTPEVEELPTSSPPFSEVISGGNCFIDSCVR